MIKELENQGRYTSPMLILCKAYTRPPPPVPSLIVLCTPVSMFIDDDSYKIQGTSDESHGDKEMEQVQIHGL